MNTTERIKNEIRAAIFPGNPHGCPEMETWAKKELDRMIDGLTITVDASKERIVLKWADHLSMGIIERNDNPNATEWDAFHLTIWNSHNTRTATNRRRGESVGTSGRACLMNWYHEAIGEACAMRAESMQR